MRRKGTRVTAEPRRNVGPLRYGPAHAHVAHLRLAPGPVAAPGRPARGAGRVPRSPGGHGPRGEGGRGAGRRGRLRPGRAPGGRRRAVRGRPAQAARHRGEDRADQRQPRLGAPARVRQRPAGAGRRAPAHPARRAGAAGAAGRRPRAGGRVRRAVRRADAVRAELPSRQPRRGTPACSATPSAASGPTRTPAACAAGSSWPTAGSPGERPANPSATSPSAESARSPPNLRPLQLRGARPPARPADARRAPALQRLAAAVLLLRGHAPQGQLADRAGRGGRQPGRARSRARLPAAEPCSAAGSPTCSARAAYTAVRARLRVGHADRPGPSRRRRWTRCGPGSRTSWCSPSSPRAPRPTAAVTGPGWRAATTGPSRRGSSSTSATPRPPPGERQLLADAFEAVRLEEAG